MVPRKALWSYKNLWKNIPVILEEYMTYLGKPAYRGYFEGEDRNNNSVFLEFELTFMDQSITTIPENLKQEYKELFT